MKMKPKARAPAAKKRRGEKSKPGQRGREHEWKLRLYVAGETERSLAALANLKKICDEHLANRYSIEVVDLSKQPQLAQADQIVALPTLVRKLPPPARRIIGDLSNRDRVVIGMDLLQSKI